MQAVASAGQLGVPVAAVALGVQTATLLPGEGPAILVGALLTVAAAALALGRLAGRASAGTVRAPR
jgi:hypothetical protein